VPELWTLGIFDMRAFTLLVVAANTISFMLHAIAGPVPLLADTNSSDDARLYGTWQQSRDAIVSFAFQQNPSWTNWLPEKIEEFKNRYGHEKVTFLNGIVHHEFGSAYETFHYQVVDRGTDYVIIRDDDPMNKGHNLHLRFVDGGRSFFSVPDSGPAFLRYDKISQDDTNNTYRSNIYDTSANGSKQISEALALAKKERKLVLLQFGANWCGWCHLLHNLFENDKTVAQELKNNYEVVMLDVTAGHNKDVDDKYGNPTRYGLPAIVILDSDGKQLTTKNTSELEAGDRHDPLKVMAFLKEWSVKKP
jgi:thiol-disulfide isomerase/thioredoxin